jgi:hypothetical protein
MNMYAIHMVWSEEWHEQTRSVKNGWEGDAEIRTCGREEQTQPTKHKVHPWAGWVAKPYSCSICQPANQPTNQANKKPITFILSIGRFKLKTNNLSFSFFPFFSCSHVPCTIPIGIVDPKAKAPRLQRPTLLMMLTVLVLLSWVVVNRYWH